MIGKSFCDDFASNEQLTQGPEHFAQHLQLRSGESAEGKRMLSAVDFGNYLAKEQEQEGEEHRHDEELEPYCLSEVDGLVEAEIQDDDDGDVHQVVADKDCGEQTFAVVQQRSHFLVGFMLALVDGTSVVGCEAEEGYLACRDEARAQEQHDNYAESNPYACRRHVDTYCTDLVD